MGRFEPGELPWAKVEAFAAWIRALGIDPTDMALRAAVVHSGPPGSAGGYQLHLMRHVRDAQGRHFVNAALDDVVMESVIVEVEKDSWPDWLTGMHVGPAPATVQIRSDGSEFSEAIVHLVRQAVRRHRYPEL